MVGELKNQGWPPLGGAPNPFQGQVRHKFGAQYVRGSEFHEMRTVMRVRQRYLMPVLAAAATAAGIAAALPAAADCIDGGGISICSAG